MYAKKLSIASIIITHNRINEAKSQMDIIRELWQPMFAGVDIYHEFNGKKSWYPKIYREDFFNKHKQMAHFIGANYMLNEGFKHVLQSGKKYDFIIATSADTWFYNSKRLKKIILFCKKRKYQLATSLWAGLGLSTEFFIITPALARKVFPLNITDIINKNRFFKWAYSKVPLFESVFTIKVVRAIKNPNKIYLIPGRRVVLTNNRYFSADFYASHHDREQRIADISPKIRNTLADSLENMPSLSKFLS